MAGQAGLKNQARDQVAKYVEDQQPIYRSYRLEWFQRSGGVNIEGGQSMTGQKHAGGQARGQSIQAKEVRNEVKTGQNQEPTELAPSSMDQHVGLNGLNRRQQLYTSRLELIWFH